MRRRGLCGTLATLLLATILVGTDAGSVSLPSYPLAVKSPYLSTWVPGNQITDAATAQPEFWAGQLLTWSVLARVDGTTYSLFGFPDSNKHITAAKTNDVTYTSSHTLVQLSAGTANFTLDFFSPVLPGTGDYLEQSLPYSYLTASAGSTNGKNLRVQILSAIDQTWTAQGRAANLNYTSSDSAGFFRYHNPNEVPFTESSDMATYGSVVFATDTGLDFGHACGSPSNVYDTFASNGSLSSSTACSGDDLAALSKDLGFVGSSPSNVTFAVGFDREQAVNYLGRTQTGYYRSKWPTIAAAVSFVLQNYQRALAISSTFDSDVRSKAQAVSSDFGSQYADIVEASVRQTFGALELTVCASEVPQGGVALRVSQVPANDLPATPYAFLKEISSDGNVNTMDVIFQTWPIFISLNPTYIRYMLQPILDYLEAGRWPRPWVIHDIGSGTCLSRERLCYTIYLSCLPAPSLPQRYRSRRWKRRANATLRDLLSVHPDVCVPEIQRRHLLGSKLPILTARLRRVPRHALALSSQPTHQR